MMKRKMVRKKKRKRKMENLLLFNRLKEPKLLSSMAKRGFMKKELSTH